MQGKGVVIVQDDCINTEYDLLGMNVVVDCLEGIFQSGNPGVTSVNLCSLCKESLGYRFCSLPKDECLGTRSGVLC